MRALEQVILSRHLNLHKGCLSLWWPFVVFILLLRWHYTRVVLSSPVRWIAGPVIGPDLQGQLSVHTYRASYQSRPTGPVIGPDLQGQLSVQTYRVSYRFRPTEPVIGPDLRGQLSVYFYRASYRFIPSGPVIGLFLQGQLSGQPCLLRYWSVYFTAQPFNWWP